MKQYLIDTNIVLRYLLADVKKQADEAKQRIGRAKKGKICLRLTTEVMVETVYVLEKIYRVPREKIADLLQSFVKFKYIEVEKRKVLIEAFERYRITGYDLVDLLLYVQARQEGNKVEVWSFDKDFKKIRKIAR